MGIIHIFSNNIKMFGVKYVFWDILYHFLKFIHEKLHLNPPLRKEKEEIIIKKINNYSMYIDKNSQGIHRDLYLRGIREPISTKIMQSILKQGDVVLDAGANIGYYTILESKKVGPKGLVYAIEPIKENFRFLQKNITLNKLKNVKLKNNLALSDEIGKIFINVDVEGNKSSPIKLKGQKEVREIPSTTMDGFFKDKRKPTVMRMDIEGFEHIVFKGGHKTLNSLKKIFVELHFPLIDDAQMVSLLKLLDSKGFKVHKVVLEWERSVENKTILGKLVNYFHNKRSKPLIFNDWDINKLIEFKTKLNSHLSLEVFFIK